MSDQPAGRQHYHIYSQITKSAFLHIEDALAIGKLRLFAGKYEKGKGASQTAHHYIDLDDARLLFTDLAAGKVPSADENDPAYVEYKGSGEGIPMSRILKVQGQAERVFFELSYGPGERIGEGAVIPVRGAQRQSVSVALNWLETRKLALAVLAHLAAWEVATFHARVAAGLTQQIEAAYEPPPAEDASPSPATTQTTEAESAEAAAAPESVVTEPAPTLASKSPQKPASKPAAPPKRPAVQPTATAEPEAAALQAEASEHADATAYWKLANTEAAQSAVDAAQIKDWAVKAQQYSRWDLAIRRLQEAIARNQ
jgi:hypothetical protein